MNNYLLQYQSQLKLFQMRFPGLKMGPFRRRFALVRSFRYFNFVYHSIRVDMQRQYAYAIPDRNAIELVSSFSPLLELGAGKGYWASLLRENGADIEAYDISTPSKNSWISGRKAFHPIKRDGAWVTKDNPDRTLFLCWPPYDNNLASKALSYYEGDTLVYIGTTAYGFTGARVFHDMLDDWSLVKVEKIPTWYDDFLESPTSEAIPGEPWTSVPYDYMAPRDRLYVFKR